MTGSAMAKVGAEAERADGVLEMADGRFGRALHCLHVATRCAIRIQVSLEEFLPACQCGSKYIERGASPPELL